MRPLFRTAAIVLAALLSTPAIANDSTAEMTAGGLVLRQSGSIDMLREDLYVSRERIRVNYVFRNQSDADVATIVAFPLPPLELDYEGDYSYPGEFQTRVAGQPIDISTEYRATLNGDDHTEALASLGIPLTPGDDWQAFESALNAVSDNNLRRLAELGLVEVHRYESRSGEARRHVRPLWTVQETYYWEQAFPAGRDLEIEHTYRPGVGGTAGSALAYSGFRESEWGQEMIAEYCMDESFLRGAERMAARSEHGIMTESTLGYILTTGANWRRPIGEFRLVVDKGDARNIVSFCGTGLTRLSPTQFEMRRSNWRPDRDLRVIILAPAE